MPAKSEKQRRLFAIAEHAPEKLYKKNKQLASLPQQTLHDFAATKGLHKGKGKGGKVAHKGKKGGFHHEPLGHQVSGGPGPIMDGHPGLMNPQRHTHDGMAKGGHTKRHTFHGIRHKNHSEKMSCG